VGAAGFEREAEIAETREEEAASGSGVVVETPTGDRSCGPEADLAHAMRLAAEARQWGVVADLSRQLDAVRRGALARPENSAAVSRLLVRTVETRASRSRKSR
jgi:hypothetical protein